MYTYLYTIKKKTWTVKLNLKVKDKFSVFKALHTLYNPMPGSMRNERDDVDGWLGDPLLGFFTLFLQLEIAQGLTSPSWSVTEAAAGASDSERIKSWTMSLSPTL